MSIDKISMERMFPSPLEVDRFLYTERLVNSMRGLSVFPSPLEVDRFLYFMSIDKISMESMFPSPLEVDRELYNIVDQNFDEKKWFPSPLEVDRFLYKMTKIVKYPRFVGFRPLSR